MIDECVVPQSSPNSEACEPRHACTDFQPPHDAVPISTASEHDAYDLVASSRACLPDYGTGIIFGFESLDLPDGGFHSARLERSDGFHDEARAQVTVVVLLVVFEAVQLSCGGGYEQFDEKVALLGLEPPTQAGQPFSLAAVQNPGPLRG